MARKTIGTDTGKGRPSKVAAEGRIAGVTTSDLQALLISLARLPVEADDEALDLAQEKAFEAMKAPTARRRIAAAKEALALSPLCADAYLVLARETRDAGKALDLHKRAVAAGAEALGETVFKDDAGLFWGLIQTRPYMRARHALAEALWAAGAHDESVDHYKDMLRLNPNDNQGIRYPLLDALLRLGRQVEAVELFKRYKDDASAAWAWSGALLAFRRAGDGPVARKALAKAVEANHHVPAYLLGQKRLPRTLPQFTGMGDEDEAVAYVYNAAQAWETAEDAKIWAADALALTTAGKGHGQGAVPETDMDPDRIDEAVLALLALGLHDGSRAWKGLDWAALDRLHAKGLISNPAGRAKSVVFTEIGLREALRLTRTLFAKLPLERS